MVTTARSGNRRWSREWLSIGRRHSRNMEESSFPKSPMHPSQLNVIPPAVESNNRNSLTISVPERALSPNGAPAPARLVIPRPSSDLIEAEIRRVTTPVPVEVSGGGTSNSGNQASNTADGVITSAREITQELEKIKNGKVWWWQRDDILKARMSTVILGAIILVITLVLYLALSMTGRLATTQTQVLVIMILVLAGAFFAHTLIRLFLAVLRPPPPEEPLSRTLSQDLEAQSGIQFTRGPGGYAVPTQPIPVTFPDKDSDTAVPPPAYGLWRNSMRVNPDQFYWVRRASGSLPPAEEEVTAGTNGQPPPPPLTPLSTAPLAAEQEGVSRRPPSYVSEDGVGYVLNGPRQAGTEALRRHAQEPVTAPRASMEGRASLTIPRGSMDGRASLDGRRFRPTHPSSSPRASLEQARRPRQESSPSRGSSDVRRLV